MKGTNRKAALKKSKGKGGAKKANRAHLHSGNHSYNLWMKAHTIQTQPDGQPQGKHDVKNKETCRCGACSNKNLGGQNT